MKRPEGNGGFFPVSKLSLAQKSANTCRIEWGMEHIKHDKKITPFTSLQQHPEIDSDSLTGLQRGKQVLKEETSHLIGQKKGFFLFISGNCTGIDILDY